MKMGDNMTIDFLDMIVKENESITVSKRLIPLMAADGSAHISIGEAGASFHVTCKAHNIIVEIDALQAECVDDSIAFCAHCLADELH